MPGNDDAIRAIALFLDVMSRAIVEGRSGGQCDEEIVAEEDVEEAARVDESETAERRAGFGNTAVRSKRKRITAKNTQISTKVWKMTNAVRRYYKRL